MSMKQGRNDDPIRPALPRQGGTGISSGAIPNMYLNQITD